MMGMKMPVATVVIQKFADMMKPEIDLLCPNCNSKPTWHGFYECACGATFNHWSKLKRVIASTGEEVKQVKLLEGEGPVTASAYVMGLDEFAKYVDATSSEYGVVTKDQASAANLRKLLIAMRNLNKVILIRFNDTYEERVCVLTTSISNRIILREIIPLNLAEIKDTMKVSLENVTPQEVSEAEQFVKMLPQATEDLLNVSDYRTKGVEKKPSPRVMELEQIIAQISQ
jgi:hypothetical protein